jgi:hypothetical protein
MLRFVAVPNLGSDDADGGAGGGRPGKGEGDQVHLEPGERAPSCSGIKMQQSWIYNVKKKLAIFPPPAGMSLTKLSLAGKN